MGALKKSQAKKSTKKPPSRGTEKQPVEKKLSDNSTKIQRVLDPVHGLIAFRPEDTLDKLALELINTKEFQRLRQIRQLGFSEFVFPGATHTRFIHSIGVYHMARQLLKVLERNMGDDYSDDDALIAGWAALLHDVGHGPFSHTFEGAEKKCRSGKPHETWTAEIITGTTEINDILKKHDSALPDKIAELLLADAPTNIYGSIVSSQFDADRIDYLMRDRYMTGLRGGGFDLAWLLDCLEVHKVANVDDNKKTIFVETLCLNHKGVHTAEDYILTRHNLYIQAYYHKTSRAAEMMLGILLFCIWTAIKENRVKDTCLEKTHPLLTYFTSSKPSIDEYLLLNDNVIWAALPSLARSSDSRIADLSMRLLSRSLYKCLDVTNMIKSVKGDAPIRLPEILKNFCADNKLEYDLDLILDKIRLKAYGRDMEDGEPLKDIWIKPDGDIGIKTISQVSDVVQSVVEPGYLYRIYVANQDIADSLEKFCKEKLL